MTARPATTTDHNHAALATPGRLGVSFALTLIILAVEIVAGWQAHSLALLSDAGHIVTDVVALGLGWFAAAQATRPADERNTWGYHRLGILSALANAATLLIITVGIVVAALGRLSHPQPVNPPLMIGAALAAVAVNLVILRWLGGHQHEQQDLNRRAVVLHVTGDLGASLAVVLGGVGIWLTGRDALDPLLSLAIAVVLAVGAVRVGREAVAILLEATPRDIDLGALEQAVGELPGVYGVHHVHVWGITGTVRALSCHVIIDDMLLSRSAPTLAEITVLLREHFHVAHATVQFEGRGLCQHSADCACGTADNCACPLDVEESHDRVAAGHYHA